MDLLINFLVMPRLSGKKHALPGVRVGHRRQSSGHPFRDISRFKGRCMTIKCLSEPPKVMLTFREARWCHAFYPREGIVRRRHYTHFGGYVFFFIEVSYALTISNI